MSSFDKKTSAGVASIDSTSPAGSTSIGTPDNMENHLFPLSHSALPISLTTTTTYARALSFGFRTRVDTPCNQLTTYGVSDWPTLCISPPPFSSG